MKKVALLLLIFPLLQLACDNGQECPQVNRFFNITGLGVKANSYELQNGSYINRNLNDLDSANFHDFYLTGTLKAEYYGVIPKPGLTIFPRAFARDVEPCPSAGYKGSEEILAGFYMISLGKYNADFLPGDTLTNAILINSLPVSNYLIENSQQINFQEFTVKLKEKPDPKEYQSFKVIYKLKNGETYEVTTPRFKLY
ncbi:hypothetical protein [Adhaeribacter terreus]|uniref:Lipoprotein n=1 Tax=Adhaeribacter terreus TaxID=529703 RepID=A0ABW0EE27_9BACT